MIRVFKTESVFEYHRKIIFKPIEETEDYYVFDKNDLSELLASNEFIQRGKKSDAEKIIEVLGTANASFEEVIWKRKEDQLKPYVDFIITIK